LDDVKKPLPGDKKKPAPKKSYIDLNPTLNKRFPDNVSEGVSQSKADYVIRLGLGDPDKIFFYRQAVMNPERAVTNPQLRHYVAETLERCLDLIFNDPQMWTRAQTLLRRKYPNQVASRHVRGRVQLVGASRRATGSPHRDRAGGLRSRDRRGGGRGPRPRILIPGRWPA